MKTKNPLYVVTDRGQVVSPAFGVWDALLKKAGLDESWRALSLLVQDLLGFVCSFRWLEEVSKFLQLLLTPLKST